MQVHGRGHAVEVGLTERELACQEIDEVARAVERDLEPDRRPIAPLRKFAFERAALVIAPSAAVGIAALASGRCGGDTSRAAVVVLCGANVDLSRLPWIVAER